jgi:uncharacterized protein YhfF
VSVPDLPPFELGHPNTELRRRLVDLVLGGEKTATAALADDYRSDGEPLPQPGDRFVLHDVDDRPVAVVEITDVAVIPAREIDARFARAEGEGFDSVDAWRRAHERFFGRSIFDDTLIVAQRFSVVQDS